jgi:hypothetical protein
MRKPIGFVAGSALPHLARLYSLDIAVWAFLWREAHQADATVSRFADFNCRIEWRDFFAALAATHGAILPRISIKKPATSKGVRGP